MYTAVVFASDLRPSRRNCYLIELAVIENFEEFGYYDLHFAFPKEKTFDHEFVIQAESHVSENKAREMNRNETSYSQPKNTVKSRSDLKGPTVFICYIRVSVLARFSRTITLI